MESNSITAFDVSGIIWRRKFTVLKFLVATIILVGVVTLLTPKSYKSEAKLFVRLGRENSSLGVTAGLGDSQIYSMPFNRESEINSIADMIDNKELFGQVVDQIGAEVILGKTRPSSDEESLQSNGPSLVDSVMSGLAKLGITNDISQRERAIIKLQKKVEVKASEKSNVLSVSVESYDPHTAQQIVQAICENYRRLHAKVNRSQGSAEFLVTQTELAKQALEASEDEFENFKTESELISVDRQRQVLVDRIASLENQWMDTEALRIAAKAELKALEMQLSGLSESHKVAATEGAGNEAIDGMRQELYRLQVRREEMLAKYNPSSPFVEQVEQQLKAAKEIFDEAEGKMVETVLGPNKVYEAAKIEIVQKQPALEALQSKSNVLKSQIDGVRKELSGFNRQEKEFLRLQREMTIQDGNYKRYSQTLLLANMDSSLQENNLSNLSISQAATLNPKPVRPNKLLNLLAAIFLGTAGGVARAILLEYRERSKDRTNQLESLLNLPVVASIPHQSARELVRMN